jgi:hypothetical protein
VICFRLLRPSLRHLSAIWQLLPLALFLGFVPFCPALIEGQDSILLLTLLCSAFASLGKKRDWLSGTLVGFGIFRFQWVLPLVALFILWRRWRFALGFAISSSICLGLSLWIAPFTSYVSILRHMNDAGMYSIIPRLMPNLRGLAYLLAPQHPQTALIALTLILFISTALWRPQNLQEAFLAGIVLSALIGYHVLSHDFSLLLPPIAIMLRRSLVAPTLLYASLWLLVIYVPLHSVQHLSILLRCAICFSEIALLANICDWFSHPPSVENAP